MSGHIAGAHILSQKVWPDSLVLDLATVPPMNPDSALKAFSNSIEYFKKQFQILSTKKSVSNQQLRLLFAQFQDAVDNFSRHIPRGEYVRLILQVGETMALVPSMRRASLDYCFLRVICLVEKDQQETAHNADDDAIQSCLVEAKFHVEMVNFYLLQDHDPSLSSPESIDALLKSVQRIQELISSMPENASCLTVILKGFYQMAYMLRHIPRKNWNHSSRDLVLLLIRQMSCLSGSLIDECYLALIQLDFIKLLHYTSIDLGEIQKHESMMVQFKKRLETIISEEVEDKLIQHEIKLAFTWLQLVVFSNCIYKIGKKNVTSPFFCELLTSGSIHDSESSIGILFERNDSKVLKSMFQKTLLSEQSQRDPCENGATVPFEDTNIRQEVKTILSLDLMLTGPEKVDNEHQKVKQNGTKKVAKATEESEEHKLKRQLTHDISSLLQSCLSDNDKIAALVFALNFGKEKLSLTAEIKDQDELLLGYLLRVCIAGVDESVFLSESKEASLKDIKQTRDLPLSPPTAASLIRHLIERRQWEKCYWLTRQILIKFDEKSFQVTKSHNLEQFILSYMISATMMISDRNQSLLLADVGKEHLVYLTGSLKRALHTAALHSSILHTGISLVWNITVSFVKTVDSTAFRKHTVVWKLLEIAVEHLLQLSVSTADDAATATGIFSLYLTALEENKEYIIAKEQATRAFDWIYQIRTKQSQKQIGSQVNSILACAQLDLISLIYRCIFHSGKNHRASANDKVDEHQLGIFGTGDSPIMKAILNLAILSDPDSEKSNDTVFAKKTFALLKQAETTTECETNIKQEPEFRPFVVNYTSTTCTIGLDSNFSTHFKNGDTLYCICARKHENLNTSSTSYVGTGITRPIAKDSSMEMTIGGLTPNVEYSFAFVLVPVDKKTRPILSESIQFIPSWDLPISFVWGYLGSLCCSFNHLHLAHSAMNQLQGHFMEATFDFCLKRVMECNESAASPYFPIEEVMSINYDLLRATALPIKQLYTQTVLLLLDKPSDSVAPYLTMIQGTTKQNHLLDLIKIMIVTYVSKEMGDFKLMTWTSVQLFKAILPHLLVHSPLAIINTALNLCHDCLTFIYMQTSFEATSILRDVYVPVSYGLVKRLINLGHFQAACCFEMNTAAVLSRFGFGSEMKFSNSAIIEQNLLGYTSKSKKGQKTHGKPHYIAEFLFHAKTAVTGNVTKGLTTDTQPQFATLRDVLDITIAKESTLVTKVAVTGSHPEITNHGIMTCLSLPSGKRPQLVQRKNLDTQGTVKDVYTVFVSCGADITLQELSRFKKNPRYLELVTHVLEWCLDREYYETIQRISTELEDWLDKRTQLLSSFESIDENDRTEIKSRKRQMFIDKVHSDILTKMGKDKRAKHVQAKPKEENHKPVVSEKRTKTPEAPNKEAKMAKYQQSIATKSAPVLKRPVSGAGTKSSHSNSDESHSSGTQNQSESDQASFIALKRKKLQQRLAYFSGLTQHEKDVKEHAAKVLDLHLSEFWRRRRYLRRLRAILALEAKWRCQMLHFKATSYLEQLRKEVSKESYLRSLNSNTAYDFIDGEWFQLSKATQLLKRPEVNVATRDSEWAIAHNIMTTMEMLQACIQSVVLSARYKLWAQTLSSVHLLWRLWKQLNRQNRIESSDFWKTSLWRGLIPAVEALLDLLNSVRLYESNTSQELHFAQVDNILVYQDIEIIASWKDSGTLATQHARFDLVVILDIICLTLEYSKIRLKISRLGSLANQIRCVMRNSFDFILSALGLIGDNKQNKAKPQISLSLSVYEARRDFVEYACHNCKETKLSPESKILKAMNSHHATIELSRLQNESDIYAHCCYQHGDILLEAGNHSSAAVFWSKCVDALFQHKKTTSTWRTLIQFPGKFESESLAMSLDIIRTKLKSPKNMLIAALATYKLGRFFYCSNYGKQIDLISFAGILFISSCSDDNPVTTELVANDLYALSKIRLPLMDKILLNPTTVCESLCWLTKRLFKFNAKLSLMLLSVANNVAGDWLDSTSQSVEIMFAQAVLLSHLGLATESIAFFQSATRRLLSNDSEIAHMTGNLKEWEYPMSSGQLSTLRSLNFIGLVDRTKNIYLSNINDFELTRVQLILSLLLASHAVGAPLKSHHQKHINSLANENVGGERVSLPFFNDGSFTPTKAVYLELESQSHDLLESTKSNLSKLITQLQFSIKAKLSGAFLKNTESSTQLVSQVDSFIRYCNRFITAVKSIATCAYLQGRFRHASKWFRSLRMFLECISPSESSNPTLARALSNSFGHDFLLQNRIDVIDSLYADSLLPISWRLSFEGLMDSKEFKSDYYQLCFWIRMLRVWIHCMKSEMFAGQVPEPTLTDLLGCLECTKKVMREGHPSCLIAAAYADCLVYQINKLIKERKPQNLIGDEPLGLCTENLLADKGPLPDTLQRHVIWFHEQLRLLSTDCNALELAKKVAALLLERSLHIPLLYAVRVCIAFSTVLMRIVMTQSSEDQNGILDVVYCITSFALKELVEAGGYDLESILTCLEQLLHVCVLVGSTRAMALTVVYMAQISHIKMTFETASVPMSDSVIVTEDLPPSVAQDIVSFMSDSDQVKEWYPEVYDLLYMDSATIERQKNSKSLSLTVKDLLSYRAWLNSQLRFQDILYDDRDSVLYRKRHRLHLTLEDKLPWYSDYCAKSLTVFERAEDQFLGSNLAFAWIRGVNERFLCIMSSTMAEAPSPDELNEQSDSDSTSKSSVLKTARIRLSDEDFLSAKRKCQRVISLYANPSDESSSPSLLQQNWKELLSLFCPLTEASQSSMPEANTRNGLFILQILSNPEAGVWKSNASVQTNNDAKFLELLGLKPEAQEITESNTDTTVNKLVPELQILEWLIQNASD